MEKGTAVNDRLDHQPLYVSTPGLRAKARRTAAVSPGEYDPILTGHGRCSGRVSDAVSGVPADVTGAT
ncbi:MAG TPA: hypothetical protein VMP08_15335 [Anaerolineae bacterium]|nr:hypothetical protein [Anaerolineae bacterium]